MPVTVVAPADRTSGEDLRALVESYVRQYPAGGGDRLRLTGEDPFALETIYLPAPEFSGLISAQLGKNSLFSTLKHDYDVDLAYADEEVDATAADVFPTPPLML